MSCSYVGGCLSYERDGLDESLSMRTRVSGRHPTMIELSEGEMKSNLETRRQGESLAGQMAVRRSWFPLMVHEARKQHAPSIGLARRK